MTVLQEYAKSAIGAIVAALGVAGTAAADGHISLADGIGIAATFFAALGSVAAVKNVLSVAQLQKQPNLPAALPHGLNVTQSYINPTYTKNLEARAEQARDEHGRFKKT